VKVGLVAVLLSCWVCADAADPRSNYMMECQGCHAADGSGGTSAIPTLKNHVAKFLTVPGGRAFLAQVPGVAQAPLSDADTAGVLNYLLAEFGPADIAARYPAYGAEEISRLRKLPLTEVAGKRADLVKQIERQELQARRTP
jgi:hypothetical protein